ncbi:n-acetylglucosamine-1-phosphotransferase subunits alpha beta [Pelomyxa schiedti]|nr:n-acetylglucosamine-1-phosphotransferase subunits alpha beta [Pelomyxa schiedti]
MFRSRGPFNQAEQQRPSHVTFVRGKYGDDAHGAESHNSASWAARESSAPLCCSGDGSFAKGEMQEGGGRTWNEYKVCRDIDVQVRYRKGTSWNGMFRDYGVLRFSVRSIAAFMPYVRDVIIVTNGQVPTWLNTSAPGIRIVTHKEIFHNSSDLPTFNSNAIEAHLHNIPGIAECFLYMNDDFFLMRDTPRTHWVDEETGKIKVYMEGGKAPQADKGGWFKSVAHSNEIVNKYYRPNENRSNPTRHHYVGHYCYFTLTEIADLMYSRWQSEFDRTSHNKFRQNNDTAFPFLNANVALEENRAIVVLSKPVHCSFLNLQIFK